VRKVVGLADVRQEEMLKLRVEDGFEQLSRFLIGEMAVNAGNALFQTDRIGTILQQVGIVVELEDQEMTAQKPSNEPVGRGSQIGDAGHLESIFLDGERNRICGVVGERDGMNEVSLYFKRKAGFKFTDGGDSGETPPGIPGLFVGINRKTEMERDRLNTVDMVPVLVRDQYPPQGTGVDADLAEPIDGLLGGEPGVDQKTGLGVPDIGAVSTASASQWADPYADLLPPYINPKASFGGLSTADDPEAGARFPGRR
jgi:hypothetical protein